MPKFTITDTFGNQTTYVTYMLNGKQVTKKVGSAKKEQMNKNSNYHGFNMSSQEMPGANTVTAAIRNPQVLHIFKSFEDSQIYGRLNGIIRGVIKQGIGEPGFREANLAAHGKKLRDFPFNKELPLSYVFQGPIEVKTNAARTQVNINTSIEWESLKRYTPTTTHAVVTTMLSTVSAHKNNKRSIKYKPTHPNQNALSAWHNTPPLDIHEKTPVNITLQVPTTEDLVPSTAIIVSLGITFGTIEKGEFFEFKTAKAMNIINIL